MSKVRLSAAHSAPGDSGTILPTLASPIPPSTSLLLQSPNANGEKRIGGIPKSAIGSKASSSSGGGLEGLSAAALKRIKGENIGDPVVSGALSSSNPSGDKAVTSNVDGKNGDKKSEMKVVDTTIQNDDDVGQ